ncbi:MAG TPA: glutamate 5-kinase [Chitinophagales bacterium]|nr:glutamate 5-kinase [Chitinophagales bacterium]
MSKPVLVFKIGTSSITTAEGEVDEVLLTSIAQQISELHQKFDIVIVSSGAVGTGKKFIEGYSGKIGERKAAAAIGNPILVGKYAKAFEAHQIPIAQSLCERHHFSNRNQFLQLRDTYQELWKHGVIPIANENDVVSNLELKFSDNDELATLLAIGFGAELLLIATSVPGVLDANDELVPKIEKFTPAILGYARKDKTSVGLGGMISKLTFARLATSLGIRTVIFGARSENGIIQAVEGNNGTICTAKKATANARQKWLASGRKVYGRVQVDEGAKKALLNRKSLLSVGVTEVLRSFEKGEVFDIIDIDGWVFAVALAKMDSEEVVAKEKKAIVAGADDIVLI